MNSRFFCLYPRLMALGVCALFFAFEVLANAHSLNCDSITLEEIQNAQIKNGYSDSSRSQWFEVDNPQGVALVIHGINAKPKIMQPLIEWLNSKEISAFRVTLSGHGENMEEFYHVSRKQWLREVYDGYCIVDRRAQKDNLNKYFLGYSLGGLLFSDFYTKYNNASVEKMVLFAPPYEVTFLARSIRVLFWADKLVIPSLANVGEYRAHWGVPISAYKALFQSKEALEGADISKLKKTPAIVVINKKDELVSFSSVKKWMTDGKMKEWEFFEVDNSKSPLNFTYDHMITEEKFLGASEWNRLMIKLNFFINAPTAF